MPATMRLSNCVDVLSSATCQIQLAVNDHGAVYPITVDPIATDPDWSESGGQLDADFGYAVAGAGDVNGDGYDDVIIGAPRYDNGETDEGRVFAYYGSASGLATSTSWTAESNQASAEFGHAVAGAGDVNNDGYADVVVGAPSYDNGQTDEGQVFVYYGSSSGLSATADWTAESDQADANFGYDVATVGDVNNDGYDGIIIGAPYYDNGQSDEGRTYVFYGSASGLNATPAWTAESNQANAEFGHAVAGAGDVNNDGYADVIVGAPWYDNGQTDEGQVFVYHGSSSGLSTTADWTADESDQADACFGCDVATAGDVNGDGYDDIIIGAPYYDNGQSDAGKVYAFHGSSSGLNTSAAWTAESDTVWAYLGSAVAAAGDVNQDGYDDVIVGAYFYKNGEFAEGKALVYHGAAAGLSSAANWYAEGNQASANFGIAVAGAGDVNGDGYDDAIIGAHQYDGQGSAFSYYGSSNGLSAIADWTAEQDQQGAQLGRSVSTAGDVNNDGYDDVIIGAPEFDNGQSNEGRVFVYYGAQTGLSLEADWMAEGDQANARFGKAVANAGDVNDDGYDDVIIGSEHENGQAGEGRATVYHGSASGLGASADWTVEGNWAGAFFGDAVAGAGDINGDGYDDVIIGAQYYDNGQTDEGKVAVYFGSSSGLETTSGWEIESNQGAAYLGISVSTAGDVNGDGYADIIVGEYRYDNGQESEGGAFVYYGSASGLAGSTPDWSGESDQASAAYGYSVSSAGDINNDGYGDVIVGAPYFDNGETDEGRVYVYTGTVNGLNLSAAWTAEGNQGGAYFGYAVSAAGDVNGDGYDDILVGAPYFDDEQTDEGQAFLYYGSSSGLSATADWTFASGQANARLGKETAVSEAGDVNGDGYGDIIFGASYYVNGQSREGLVFVFHGSGQGVSLPEADFEAIPLSGTVPLTVTFTNSSLNAGSFLWHFGDGITSTIASPQHTYTQAGVYTVALSAYGAGGLSDVITKTNYITATAPLSPSLEADFTAVPINGNVPLTVTFNDNSTDNITNYDWDFGDGNQSNASSPVHTYTEDGIYTVSLTVTGTGGAQDTRTRYNYIFVNPVSGAIPNAAPVITITNPVQGSVVGSYSVQVNGQVTDDGTVQSVLVNNIPASIVGNTFSASITVGSGNQTINAVAEDNEGAMGFDSTVVQVDDAGPRIDIDQPPNRQAIYSSTPTLSISYSDFLSDIDTGSLLVQLTDENNVITDVTSYLTVAADSANGTLSTPLINNSSFTLTVTVADTRGNNGSAQSTFYVADGVTPPIEPANAAWASGVVYDSGTCSNEYLTTCQGLAGVQVTAAEIDPETRVITPVVGTVVSGPDGFFAFPFDKTGFFTLHFEKDTFTYSQREVAVVRGRSTATNEIYLTPLDTAVETCGNSGCTYANSSDTIRLDIPAGAIPKGETIDVVATVLEQVEFLPSGDLPPDTWETYAFNLSGDSDIQFMRPITVQMANTRNFDPGTRIPLGYWNPDTLQWEHKGVGTVDETGQWLVMHVTHFSMYDCNAGVTQLTLGNLLASLLDWLRSNGSCTAGTPGCFIDAKSGQLREWIQLPAVSILGESVAPQLGYSTARANPSAVIDIELNLNYDAQFVDIADYLYFELYIEGEKTDTFTFSVAPDENGEVGRFRYFWDGRNALGELLPPGIYEYAVRVRIPYTAEYYWSNISLFGQRRVTPTGVTTEATRSEWLYGTVELNTQVDSALGSGWVLEGHQHLTADEAGRILVTEDDNITEYYNGLVSSLYGRRQYNLPQPPVVGPAASVTISPQPAFGTHVSGTIASNTNWTTVNSPYILDDGNVTVADGVMLTIEPDVQVMIDQDLSLLVNGVISASGTATSPITFTAYTDGFYEDWTTYPITNTELSGRMTVETAATDAWGNTWLGGNVGGYGGSVGITRLGTDLTLDSFTLSLYFSSASTIYGVAIDSAGQKWFVSDHGVAMLPADNDDANWTEYTQSNSELLSDYVYAVAVDANDGLWFGTDSGVNHLTAGGSWTSYTEANSDLASDSIRSIAVGQNGDILVGTSDAGLSVFDGTDWTIYNTSNSDILGNGILDIAEDNAGNIWLAVAGQGISVLQTNSSWENYTTSNSDLVNNFVTSVAVDIRNRKWIGYQNDGVSTLSADNQSWLHEAYPTLASNYVWGIAASPNGDVWLAMDTDAGISRYHEVEYYDGAISGGYWGQVKIGGGANMNDSDGSLLRYVTFESGGVGGQSLVHVDSSTITLENVRIGGSGGDGLTIEDSSNVTLNEVISEANEGTGIKIIGGAGGHIFTDVQSWDNKEHGLWLAHNGRITVTNATLAKNLGYAIFTEGSTANITLQNSTMQGNYQSARLAADAVLIDNDWLENDSNRIEWTGGTITGDRTWSNSWDSHTLLGNVTVSDGVTLTIEPGTTILLDPGRSLFVNGILEANGSFEASIYFASSSRASAWQYVQIGGGVDGDSDDSILRYVIAQGGSRGLYVYRSMPTLEYLTLIDNSYGMYVQESSDVTVANSNFARNSLYGLYNASPSQIVTATHNYWGSTNGPNYSGHPSDGQDVSGGVIVDPWRGPVLMDGIQPFTAGRTEIDRSTLVYDETTGNYIRRYYNGYEVYFDALGRHDYSLTPDGRIISFTYNLDNSIATMSIIAPGESTPHWTWTFNYVNSKLDSITDPAGRVTDFTIDENGQLTEVSFPDGSSEAYFYDARNLLTQHVDKNGAVTSYAYDEYGRVLTDTRPIRAVYDPATNTIVAEAEERTFIASEVAYPLINDSPVGDPITPAPAVPTSTVLVDSITFGRGSVSGLTNMWGNWLEFTDATDRTIQYDRNSANYIFRQTYPDSSCDRFSYDYFGNVVSARRMGATDCALGNPVNFLEAVMTYEPRFNQIKSITDPLGRTTTYIYDYEEGMGENGNVIRIEYPPIQDESGNWITPTMQYTYNSLGLMETQQNENGALTRYVYTTITDTQLFLPGVTPVPGLLTQVIEDDGGLALTTTYRDFDANGTALTEIAPGGVEMTHYATDEMGRVISETNAAGATTLYDYDAQGNLIQRIADYTPDGVTGANLVTLYTYDADNRLLTEERVGDEIIVRTSHMADINGNPSHSENAMGHETISLYDDANRLVNMIDPAGQVVTYTHDVNGRVASFTNVDDIINKTFYDDYGRVYRTVRNWEDGIFNPNEPDKDIESLTAYDDMGNTIIVTDTLGRMTRTVTQHPIMCQLCTAKMYHPSTGKMYHLLTTKMVHFRQGTIRQLSFRPKPTNGRRRDGRDKEKDRGHLCTFATSTRRGQQPGHQTRPGG
ncbi:MAG: FG-GAP repeat protein [Anaerolineae bacterium]|nr:FG-GAP repeat protein [Anaerolineae bacterium]